MLSNSNQKEEISSTAEKEAQFKKQRQIYLQEKRNRKKEVKQIMKKDYGSSSSDEEDVKQKKKEKKRSQPKINEEMEKKSSLGGSKQTMPSEEEKQIEFKKARQEYMAERMARKKEAKVIIKKDFGSSSSEEDEAKELNKIKNKKRLKRKSEEEINAKAESNQFKEQFNEPSPLYTSLNLQKSKINKEVNQLKINAKLNEKKNVIVKEKIDIEVQSKKGSNVWIEEKLQFKENLILLSDSSYALYDITKIKMLLSKTGSGSTKMKISYKQEDLVFAAHTKSIVETGVDLYFYIFAKVVQMKMALMSKNLNPYQLVPPVGVPDHLLKGAFIYGKILKLQIFGKGEERFTIINNLGLFMFKKLTDKPILSILSNSVKQIWTRFEVEKDYLIVKLLQGSSKIQLGIPICNFLNCDNWLVHLYCLAAKN